MPVIAPPTPPQTATEASHSFRAFCRHWRFTNRETGEVQTFADLWEGQELYAQTAEEHRRIVALKAGKLGFTELACAYDAWRCVFGPPGRVHLFSKGQRESFSLLDYVRDGIQWLPDDWGVAIDREERGGDTASQIAVTTPWDARGTHRYVVSYPASPRISIDQTCHHAHVDELAAIMHDDAVMDAVVSTVSPYGGTCHVVSRGHGPDNRMARMWAAAAAGGSDWQPVFAPWWMRPDRDEAWYRQLEASGELTPLGLSYFAPATADEALAGEGENIYLPLGLWDTLADGPGAVPPGDRLPVVIGLDAGVSNDLFGMVVVSRDPRSPDDSVAIREARAWGPGGNGYIDFAAVERYVRWYCQGGCPEGHPRSMPLEGCGSCAAGDWSVPARNVVCVVYDPHELTDMAQRLAREEVAWMAPFKQGEPRLVADAQFRRMAHQGRIRHNGDPVLREHVGHARAKTYAEEDDSRVRIVKAAPEQKVDLVVAGSMAAHQCLRLNLAG